MHSKIAAVAGIATVIVSSSATAECQWQWTELEKQAMVAQQRLEEADKQLRLAAQELYEVFTDASDLNIRHAAEKAIREFCPQEYGEFIVARGVLDDLMYAINLEMINSITPAK